MSTIGFQGVADDSNPHPSANDYPQIPYINRTRYGIGESISTDQAKTWSPTAPSEIIPCATRFFISRLNSGKMLLVELGPVDQNVGRSQLTGFVSDDDGQTWSKAD